MDGIRGNTNPLGKLTGILNAQAQHQKHGLKEKGANNIDAELGKNKLNPVATDSTQVESSSSQANFNKDYDFQISLGIGENTTNITYTKEDLMKNVVSIGNENNSESNQSVILIDLDLEKVLKDFAISEDNLTAEIQISEQSENKTVTTLKTIPQLNTFQLGLITANTLEMNIALKIGNDVISIGNNASANFKFDVGENNGEDVFVVGNNSTLNFDTSSKVDNTSDILIIGNNSKVDISSQVDIDNGDDIMIVGNNSVVNVKGSVGADNGNDTLILGNNSTYIFEGQGGINNGNDTIILGNNAKMIYKGTYGVNNGNSTIILGNGAELIYEGSIDGNNRNSNLVIGKNVTVNMKISMKDYLTDYLIGKDADKLFKEIEKLGDRLKKFRIGNTSLKDIIDEALDDVKEALRKTKTNRYKQFYKKNDLSDGPLLQLATYSYINHQLSGMKLVFNYVSELYKQNKANTNSKKDV